MSMNNSICTWLISVLFRLCLSARESFAPEWRVAADDILQNSTPNRQTKLNARILIYELPLCLDFASNVTLGFADALVCFDLKR